jgi:hypothetical protein
MSPKIWTPTWPEAVDDDTSLPEIVVDDYTNHTQPNAIKQLLIGLEAEVGETVPAAGSLKHRVDSLEASAVGALPVEDEFETTGLETPDILLTFQLTGIPRGGSYSTPSTYDLAVFRNGIRLKYQVSPTSQYAFEYVSGTNRIRVLASGNIDDISAVYSTTA